MDLAAFHVQRLNEAMGFADQRMILGWKVQPLQDQSWEFRDFLGRWLTFLSVLGIIIAQQIAHLLQTWPKTVLPWAWNWPHPRGLLGDYGDDMWWQSKTWCYGEGSSMIQIIGILHCSSYINPLKSHFQDVCSALHSAPPKNQQVNSAIHEETPWKHDFFRHTQPLQPPAVCPASWTPASQADFVAAAITSIFLMRTASESSSRVTKSGHFFALK